MSEEEIKQNEVIAQQQAEELRLEEEARAQEEIRIAEEARIAEEERLAEEARLAELKRLEDEAIQAVVSVETEFNEESYQEVLALVEALESEEKDSLVLRLSVVRKIEDTRLAEVERLAKIEYWMNYEPTSEDYQRWDTYGRTTIVKDEPVENKVVYLTFDDGPMKTTIPVLDILKEYDVKATFFVNGLRASSDEANDLKLELYERIVAEGHALGNHTYSHDYKKIYESPEAYLEDFFELEDLIYELTGSYTGIMRFPGGSNNSIGDRYTTTQIVDAMHDMGYAVFDWNVMDYDTENPTLTQMRDYVINGVHNASKKDSPIIVLYHDTHYGHQTTLPQVIEQLQSEGYVFKTLTSESAEVIFNGAKQ
jgi:peptidoglycan/xylan/chitin deacetylase (PgdA/CDA1 family)